MNTVITTKTNKSAGFTLLELSIVLVIIGLIVGGVLVGQDLIKAAEIRATVGQYEKYNTAINTFRTKYDGIPGDLAQPKVEAFGLTAVAGETDGTTGLGDGNGIIESPSQDAAGIGEPLLFWQQLSSANLVDGSYSAAVTTDGAVASNTSGSDIGLYLPLAKIGKGNYWTVGSSQGTNYYILSGFTGATVPLSTTGTYDFAPAMTPIEAYNIDVKIDDGLPNTGTTQARGTASDETLFEPLDTLNMGVTSPSGSEEAGDCTTGTAGTSTSATYSRGTAAGNAPGCALRMRFN